MKIGFIGNGNMGSAIINGIIKNKISAPADIIISDINTDGLKESSQKYGVITNSDNKITAAKSDILVLAVKPSILYNVIDEIKDCITENTIVVSIVAGQSISKIENAFGKEIKLIRVMPNTPAFVGEAMSGISPNANVNEEEYKIVLDIFNSIGKAEIIPENLMDTVTGISGSSPAYVFMFIEAMADAAVKGGMPRVQAYKFAAQAVLGSAKMVLETGMHPGELKDMVCSPGGTTISAVEALENSGFRGAVMDAVAACIEKSKNL